MAARCSISGNTQVWGRRWLLLTCCAPPAGGESATGTGSQQQQQEPRAEPVAKAAEAASTSRPHAGVLGVRAAITAAAADTQGRGGQLVAGDPSRIATGDMQDCFNHQSTCRQPCTERLADCGVQQAASLRSARVCQLQVQVCSAEPGKYLCPLVQAQ